MAHIQSFRLPGIHAVIPCPRCGRTDCARAEMTKGRRILYCSTTWREVSPELLNRTAKRLHLPMQPIGN